MSRHVLVELTNNIILVPQKPNLLLRWEYFFNVLKILSYNV